MDREGIAIYERHRARALHDLVLKASAPHCVVLCIGSVSTRQGRVWRAEVDLGAAVPSELANRWSHERQRDGEAVPFRLRSERGRQWEAVSMALVPCDVTAGNEDGSVGCGFAESAEVEATVAEQSRQLPPSVLAIEAKIVAQAILPSAPAACMGKESAHE